MERTGESLNQSPIKYPGRAPRTTSEFLEIRSDIKSLYIYDTLLSSGDLLYRCKGGIGVSKEKYIVDMHKFLAISPCVSYIRDVYDSVFNENFSKGTYLRIRAKFNEDPRLRSWNDHAILYCLWAASAFRHRYLGNGYNARFDPTKIHFESLLGFSELSRDKNIYFRNEDFFSISDSLINENVVVYAHIPNAFGKYGCNFFWNKEKLLTLLRVFSEYDKLGYKVCVSCEGHLSNIISPILNNFLVIDLKQFKENRYHEIYYLNF